MRRKFVLASLIAILIVALIPGPTVQAQSGENAATAYQLNMRTGADTSYDIVATLPPGTPLALEARNADTSWVLGHTLDNAHRGWLASLYLSYAPGFAATGLPVSSETLNPPPAAPEQAPPETASQQKAAPMSGIGAYTSYRMNVRSGPGTSHSALGQIAASTGLVLEARNTDSSWVLAHTRDNAVRGWFASLYLNFTVAASSLPVSDEIVSAAAPNTSTIGTAGSPGDQFDMSRVTGIDLTAYPVAGRATGNARAIFAQGRGLGNNPNVVTTVGDCSSEHWHFLNSFSGNDYDLGAYGNLQPVINHFKGSLGYDSEADHNGFNANAVLSPEWANPAYCQEGESPLKCEFRRHNPSAAIIMFGTSDLLVMAPAEFDHYMRLIVEESIDAGVIPILSTFPGNLNFWDKTILYNQIVVRIALDFDIPLINLWLALERLPNHGLESDGFHLSETGYSTSCYLTEPYLQSGYPTRNLVTMQTLDNVWRGAMR